MQNYIFTGVLKDKKTVMEGTSQRTGNPWRKQQFVVEDATGNSFPRMIAFDAFNDTVDTIAAFSLADTLTVAFHIEAREYNGRWYNDLKIESVTKTAVSPQQPAPQPVPAPQPQPVVQAPIAPPQATAPAQPQANDLPF